MLEMLLACLFVGARREEKQAGLFVENLPRLVIRIKIMR
jgi:hypothetical protein